MTQPVGNKVLIQPDYESGVQVEGQIIQVTTKVPKTGTILALAEGYDYAADETCGVTIKVGDKVAYEHNRKCELEDKTILLPVSNIQYVITPIKTD